MRPIQELDEIAMKSCARLQETRCMSIKAELRQDIHISCRISGQPEVRLESIIPGRDRCSHSRTESPGCRKEPMTSMKRRSASDSLIRFDRQKKASR